MAVAAVVALAQPLSYAHRRTTVNAGVLLIESQRIGNPSVPANPAPHIWFNIDSDSSVKPAGWTFDSPMGQSSMTADMWQRWRNRPGAGFVPPVGSRISKRDASYWEVSLTTVGQETMARFDVLSLSLNGTLSLNSIEREKLRNYIDQGGILWVDLINDASIGLDLANGIPYGFDWMVSNAPIQINPAHPLLRRPNLLSVNDVRRMDYAFALSGVVTLRVNLAKWKVARLLSWIEPDSRRLEPVAANVDGNTISSGRLGDGYIVVTSRGVSATLNRGFNRNAPPPAVPQVNRGFAGLEPVVDPQFTAAAKFVVNLLSLNTSYAMPGAGSRKSSSSGSNVRAPLLERFNVSLGAIERDKPPALFKGYLITSIGGRVTVFDAQPDRDIDGDGDPDDGEPDLAGSGADLIWRSVDLGRLSSPAVVEVTNTSLVNPDRKNLLAINQIWVVDNGGTVHIFDLETPEGSEVQSVEKILPPNGEFSDGSASGPHAPTFHEGVAFVHDTRASDGNGRIRAIDLNTAIPLFTDATEWVIKGTGALQPAGASPTVGYIPIQDNSSGLDRVVYLPMEPTVVGTPQPAAVASIWFGARGERPIRARLVNPGILRITTRASRNGLPVLFAGSNSSLGIKITILKPNGDPFTLAEMEDNLNGTLTDPGTNGEIDIGISTTAWDWDGTITPGNPNDDVGWRVDYTIDWGGISTGLGGVPADKFVRGKLQFPDTLITAGSGRRRIQGNVALGSTGNLYVVTASPDPRGIGGTLFNLREEGRGQFRLVYRYDLYDQMTFQLNNSSGTTDSINWPGAVTDEDELLIDFPFLGSSIWNLRFVGGPSVVGDTVYCVAAGGKRFGISSAAFIDASVLFAFEANPGPLEFEIEGSADFTLVQPDISRSTNKLAPTQFSVMRRGQFTTEPIPNTNRRRVILKNAMTTSSGRITDSISSSLPVIIRRSGQTDLIIEPESPAVNGRVFPGFARGRFDPLVWYVVLNGFEAVTAPVVAGETLYFAGSSILPSIFASGFTPPFRRHGLIYAFDAQISPSDPFLRTNSIRPWHQQLSTFVKRSAAPGDFIAADAMLWPQFQGARSIDDLRVRVLQAALPEERVLNLAVGDGALAATSDQRVHGFTRSDFVVVDEGRVSRFDAAGNPVWSATQTVSAGLVQPNSAASTGVRLSRPTRLYPTPDGGFWIVDSGNNRVALIDAAGTEQRTISRFKIDPKFVPQGMSDSESLDLSDPRDVFTFTSRVVPADNPFSNARPLELWRHVLIAEAGNNRIVELVDRYELNPGTGRLIGAVQYFDPNSTRPGGVETALGMLRWHTPEELSGKRYAYNSIDDVFIDDGFGGKRRVVAFGFGNVEPGRATFGLDSSPQDLDVSSGFGGIVIYDGASTLVITDFSKPAIPAGAFLVETGPGTGLYDFLSAPKAAEPNHKIAGLSSVTLRVIPTVFGVRLAVMVSEASGVYEIIQPNLANPDQWEVNWMLPTEAYRGVRRPRSAGPYNLVQLNGNALQFRPMYSRRLDSGEVLIVNGYVGLTFNGSTFNGEVALFDGRILGTGNEPGYDVLRPNLGFNSLSIKYELPPVLGIRGIMRPVYAERQ